MKCNLCLSRQCVCNTYMFVCVCVHMDVYFYVVCYIAYDVFVFGY